MKQTIVYVSFYSFKITFFIFVADTAAYVSIYPMTLRKEEEFYGELITEKFLLAQEPHCVEINSPENINLYMGGSVTFEVNFL